MQTTWSPKLPNGERVGKGAGNNAGLEVVIDVLVVQWLGGIGSGGQWRRGGGGQGWGQWAGLRVTPGCSAERGREVVVLTDVQTDQWFRESGRRAANADVD